MKHIDITVQTRISAITNKDRSKLLDFSRLQFDALKKKKLRMPVVLYHL